MAAQSKAKSKQKSAGYLFEGSEWTFDKLKRTYAAIEEIATKRPPLRRR